MEVKDMIRKHRPRLLFVSLPLLCKRCCEDTPEKLAKNLKRKQKSKKMIKNGIEVARLQI